MMPNAVKSSNEVINSCFNLWLFFELAAVCKEELGKIIFDQVIQTIPDLAAKS
jgi:hypothetical protein